MNVREIHKCMSRRSYSSFMNFTHFICGRFKIPLQKYELPIMPIERMYVLKVVSYWDHLLYTFVYIKIQLEPIFLLEWSSNCKVSGSIPNPHKSVYQRVREQDTEPQIAPSMLWCQCVRACVNGYFI